MKPLDLVRLHLGVVALGVLVVSVLARAGVFGLRGVA